MEKLRKKIVMAGLAGLLLVNSSCIDQKSDNTESEQFTKACMGEVNLPLNLVAQFADTYLNHPGPEYIYIGSKRSERPGDTIDVGYLLVVPGYEKKLGWVDVSEYPLIPINSELQAMMGHIDYPGQGYSFTYGTYCLPIKNDDLKKKIVDSIFEIEKIRLENYEGK